MRLGSRDPLGKDDPPGPGQPRPIASGVVIKRSAPRVPSPEPGSQGPSPGGQTSRSSPTGLGRQLELPALALIECASIAVGFLVADAVVKKAPVRLLRAQTASPGKFLVLFAGDVASALEAHQEGLLLAADVLLDDLLLPNAHPTVLPALEGLTAGAALDSFAVIETFSLAAAIVAADVAVKAAPVTLIEIRPPIGLGGKSFVSLTGGLEDLQAAVGQALDRVRPGGMICRHVLIPNPHPDLDPFVF